MLSESIRGGKEESVTQGPGWNAQWKGLAFRLFISLQESIRFVLKKPMVNGRSLPPIRKGSCAVRKTPHVL